MSEPNLYAGRTAARYIKALAMTGGDQLAASGYAAAQRWTDASTVAMALKAAVVAMDTDDVSAAMAPIARDFSAFLRPRTIMGRVLGFRRAVFQTRMLTADSGTVGRFVAEGKPIPLSSASFLDAATLQFAKCGAIAVVTKELAMSSRPGAEMVMMADVGRAVALGVDYAFVDPANGGGPGTPAAVTNGATSFSSSGSSLAAVDADLSALVAVLTSGLVDLTTAVWVMSARTATFLTLLRGASGAPAFPGMRGPLGGELLGMPVLTSDATMTFGSPNESIIALISADSILVADDGEAEVSTSSEGTLEFTDTPTDGAVPQVSLYQNNLVAIKGLRSVNWSRRRQAGVAVLTDVTY